MIVSAINCCLSSLILGEKVTEVLIEVLLGRLINSLISLIEKGMYEWSSYLLL
ncbi:hypothetical protein Nhal_4012 (plasmid) [Nitrosococcus halophilus Nc 4]|uniref:Uncharacterized protein n=1 Tax=Nitrosococcus halophilus (strain Nc4) TaxID=472759 RepID=D5C5G6_NITHN|nr:hypothetical protein Nhal_4012 [Nitrosococcus halophilus Nc 4]